MTHTVAARYRLTCEMIINREIGEVFKFFEEPANLATITPAWLSFQVRSSDRVEMKVGVEIDYTIRWLGLPMHWKTLITEYAPPFRFVDEQATGPYALWRHRHTFESVREGVKARDHVEYALPLGALGQVAHAVLVGRQLRAIFNYRQAKLNDVFGGATHRTQRPEIHAC